nr:Protein ROS1 [Ipomoea batatas]
MDTVEWEAVRLADVGEVAESIKQRVDTNVGRIAVRLGWVPLPPLPKSLQLHLLEMYPILESIQKYLWPRLCKLDKYIHQYRVYHVTAPPML